MKKLISILLCLALLGTVLPVYAQETAAQLSISSAEEFLAFAENCRLDSYSQDLTVDVQKYFAFQVGNVDKAQSVPGLPEKFQQNAMNRLAIAREKYIGALVAGKAQASADEEAGNAVYKEGAENILTAQDNTQASCQRIKIPTLFPAVTMAHRQRIHSQSALRLFPRLAGKQTEHRQYNTHFLFHTRHIIEVANHDIPPCHNTDRPSWDSIPCVPQ